MKLRNKKTGGIIELEVVAISDKYLVDRVVKSFYGKGLTLAELNAEWEDYEEPKGHWTIDPMNESYIDDGKYTAPDELERYEELGLKFDTKEEAEKAVEKLKAFKRLKDKGFRFDIAPALGHYGDETFGISIRATMPEKWWYNDKVVDDIHYVFGGEE